MSKFLDGHFRNIYFPSGITQSLKFRSAYFLSGIIQSLKFLFARSRRSIIFFLTLPLKKVLYFRFLFLLKKQEKFTLIEKNCITCLDYSFKLFLTIRVSIMRLFRKQHWNSNLDKLGTTLFVTKHEKFKDNTTNRYKKIQ